MILLNKVIKIFANINIYKVNVKTFKCDELPKFILLKKSSIDHQLIRRE